MSKKRVLFVTQEMSPYTAVTEISEFVRKLTPYIQTKGMEIRVLMPKFGLINERRHRLHEVVRLSGMNIIVDDDDYPLIIKVASLPGARMQVYFLDNEEFFKRKHVFVDEEEKAFKDNQERMVFFCKGALETVKKFGWAPDVVHCHGWMTSLIPLYLKKVYNNDPIFQDSKIIYSAYKDSMEESFDKKFVELAAINTLEDEDLAPFVDGDKITLHEGALRHSDAIIKGSEELSKSVSNVISDLDVPVLEYSEIEDMPAATLQFFKELM